MLSSNTNITKKIFKVNSMKKIFIILLLLFTGCTTEKFMIKTDTIKTVTIKAYKDTIKATIRDSIAYGILVKGKDSIIIKYKYKTKYFTLDRIVTDTIKQIKEKLIQTEKYTLKEKILYISFFILLGIILGIIIRKI